VILVHLLYDFHWQGAYVAEMKTKSPFILGVHALTWALLIYAVIYFTTGRASTGGWVIVSWLFVTHYLVDDWKAKITSLPRDTFALYVDQFLHIVSLAPVLSFVLL
jgi:hypothetical protein